MKLYKIADVYMGILLNREENKQGITKYKLFNIKNYEENIEYEDFYTDKNFDNKLTKEGDILFRLVYPNKVIYVDKQDEDLLVSSQMCIIRANSKVLHPTFLKWYLESDIGKEKIMLEMKGSTIQKISLTALKNLEIPDLEIEKQNKINDLINLWSKEKQNMKSLIESKERLYNSIIKEIIISNNSDI